MIGRGAGEVGGGEKRALPVQQRLTTRTAIRDRVARRNRPESGAEK